MQRNPDRGQANRTFHMEDGEVWKKASRIARISGLTLSKVLEAYLRRYVADNEPMLKKIDKMIEGKSNG